MTGRFDAPGLARTPGYSSHAAASFGNRLVLTAGALTAGAVPLDAEGSLVGEGDRVVQTH